MTTINGAPDGHSDLWANLQKLTKQLQKQITEASQRGENTKIFTLAERLRRADALVQRFGVIRQEVEELTRLQGASPDSVTTHSSLDTLSDNGQHADDEAPKARGKRLRTAWIAKYGITLKHLRRTLYKNSDGDIVGIACATEKEGLDGPEGRWWLGLPKGQFQNAVLLCEQNDGSVRAVCLPKGFIETHRDRLSKGSSGEQEQFTVLKNSAKWYLQVPTTGAVEISTYIDNPSSVL